MVTSHFDLFSRSNISKTICEFMHEKSDKHVFDQPHLLVKCLPTLALKIRWKLPKKNALVMTRKYAYGSLVSVLWF